METKIQKEMTNLTPTLTVEEINLLKQQAEDVRAQQAALEGTSPEQIIEFYLDYQQSRKPELNNVYPDNKQGKTIKDCYRYILNKAEKQKNGNVSMVNSKIVFGWAEEYFLDEKIEKFENKITAKSIVSKTTAQKPLKKEELQKKHDDWEIQNKQYIDTWNTNQKKKIEDWETKHKKEIATMQMDIFTDPAELEKKKKEVNPYLQEQCPYLNNKNPYQLPTENNTKTPKLLVENGETIDTTTGEIIEDELEDIEEIEEVEQ